MLDLDGGPLVAYFGLGEGASLLPYFFALMSFAGVALIAAVQWPFSLLVRRLRRGKRPESAPNSEVPLEGGGDER